MRSSLMSPSRCLQCFMLLNAATDPTGQAHPVANDATVCMYCGHVMVFADDMSLRNPTADESGVIEEVIGSDARVAKLRRAFANQRKQ